MAEGYVNLFINDYHKDGDNKPHYKGFLKIDGVEHEFALWPAKEGKKGFSGKYKPKQPKESESNVTQSDADKAWAQAAATLAPKPEVSVITPVNAPLNDEIPF